MRVRAITNTGDWTFGSGQSNYKTANACVEQLIQTGVSSWLGNCFFDINRGIDWLNALGGYTNPLLVQLAVQVTIANIEGVTGILDLSLNLNHTTRGFSVSYQVQTIYSSVGSAFIYTSVQGA